MADDISEGQVSAREKWTAAALQALRGAPMSSLTTTTYDGIEISPLYTRSQNPTPNSLGAPGADSFRRGGTVDSTTSGWEVRQRHNCANQGVNDAVLTDLARGVTGLTISNAHSLDDLDRVLDGVLLDIAPIHLAPGASEAGVQSLQQLWARRGHSPSEVRGCLGVDQIAALARRGATRLSLDDGLDQSTSTAEHTASSHPFVATYDIDGTAFADAGASDGQELAAVLAGGLRSLRAMLDNGMDLETATRQIRFTLSVGPDQFGGIAKLRAARQCWARIVEACGGPERARGMHIHAITARAMFTHRDPWVNMLRGTTACFAAAAGGADAITVSAFDSALGQASELGLRVARNTQTIIAEEAGIGSVIDPAGGSWFVEDLTGQVAQRAWTLFQAIEARGGIGAAMLDGSVHRAIADTVKERRSRVGSGDEGIVGVSVFPDAEETLLERMAHPESLAAEQSSGVSCEPLGTYMWTEPIQSPGNDAGVRS